jgi:hypothetical protein
VIQSLVGPSLEPMQPAQPAVSPIAELGQSQLLGLGQSLLQVSLCGLRLLIG